MRYILDLSGVEKIPSYYGGIKELPVKDGEHFKDYDVIEAEVDLSLLARIKRIALGFKKAQLKEEFDEEGSLSMPLGFDLDELPSGARLIPVGRDPNTLDMFSGEVQG